MTELNVAPPAENRLSCLRPSLLSRFIAKFSIKYAGAQTICAVLPKEVHVKGYKVGTKTYYSSLLGPRVDGPCIAGAHCLQVYYGGFTGYSITRYHYNHVGPTEKQTLEL